MKRILMVGYIEFDRDPRVIREAKALQGTYEVEVLGLKNDVNRDLDYFDGIKIYKVPVSRRMSRLKSNYLIQYNLFFILAFVKTLFLSIKKNYDVYYFHNTPDYLVFIGLFQKVLFNKKIILDIHDPMLYSLKTRFNLTENCFVYRCIKYIEKLSWRFADEIITVNKACKKLIETTFDYKKDIHVVLNLPDKNIFDKDKAFEVPEFKDRYVLLYHGTLTKWYGVDIAIKAIRLLKDKIPEILLCIIGKGPEFNGLNNLAKELDVEKYVMLKDSIPQKDIVTYIKASSIGISPHLDIEYSKIYFSTKVAEYLYCNKMVICSRTEGILDYFDENELIYFNPGDVNDFSTKVLEAYSNPTILERKIKLAGIKLSSINWNDEKNKLISIINKMCS